MTGYIHAVNLRFEDQDAKKEPYADLEKGRYERCIQDMFTKIQMNNDKALVTGAAPKRLILEQLAQKILEQMHTVDFTGKTDQEIITISMNAGRTAEKWNAARNILSDNISLRSNGKYEKTDKRSDCREKRCSSSINWKPKDMFNENRFQKKDRKESQETKKIEASKLASRKAAGECLRCTWPSERKGSNRVKHCKRPIKLDKGMADFLKAKEYQRMKLAAMQLTTEDDSDSDERDSDSECSDCEETSDSEESEASEELEGEILD